MKKGGADGGTHAAAAAEGVRRQAMFDDADEGEKVKSRETGRPASQKRSSESTARTSLSTAAPCPSSASAAESSAGGPGEMDEDVSSAYHTALTVATTTASTTTELFHKLDGLQVKWTSQKEDEQSNAVAEAYGAMHNHADDQSSVLSMGSFSSFRYYDANARSPLKRGSYRGANNQQGSFSVQSLRRGSLNSSSRTYHSTRAGDGAESVFDRLYNDARAKSERLKRRQQQQQESDSQSVASSYYSFYHQSRSAGDSSVATPQSQMSKATADGSVYDRLYKNERKPCHRRHRISPANITPTALERRLNYRPNLALTPHIIKRSPRTQSTRIPVSAPSYLRVSSSPREQKGALDSSLAPSSVFERLHRREPRPRAAEPIREPSSQSRTDKKPRSAQPEILSKKQRSISEAVLNIVSVQSLWRGWSCRVAYKAKQSAALRIQQAWKRRVDEGNSFFHSTPAVLLALYHLPEVPASQEKIVQEMQRVASVMLQATWRARAQQRKYTVLRYSVLELQRIGRGHLGRCTSLRLRRERYRAERESASSLIQAWWRKARDQRSYQTKRVACSILQSAVRNYEANCRTKKGKCAILIQLAFRRHFQRTSHIRWSDAARRIQSFYRRQVRLREVRCTVLRLRELQGTSSKMLQARWRGYKARSQFQLLRLAATQIQSLYRGIACRVELYRRRQAATSIVMLLRRSVHSRRCRWDAAIKIQSRWRVFQSSLVFISTVKCVVCIQSLYRRYRKKMQLESGASSIIQRNWRASRCRWRYLVVLSKARVIQATWREHVKERSPTGKEDVASLTSRGACDRANAETLVRLQAHVRCRLAMRSYRILKLGIVSLQATCRGRRSRCRLLFDSWRLAAVALQRRFRSIVSKRSLLRLRQSAVVVQRVWRGHFARQGIYRRACIPLSLPLHGNDFSEPIASTALDALSPLYIRAAWRQARSEYQLTWTKAVAIQTYYRRHSACCYVRRLRFSDKNRTESLIDANSPLEVQSQSLSPTRVRSAIVIQTACRMYLARTSYKCFVACLTLIQAALRGSHERRRFGRKLVRQAKATLLIQALWRMHCNRSTFEESKAATVVLQSFFRGWKQLIYYKRLLLSVRRLQNRCRVNSTNSRLRKRRLEAALRIQAAWRSRVWRVAFLSSRAAAIVLQTLVRKQMELRERKTILRAVCILQAATRRLLVRSLLMRQHEAAATIQKTWRVFVARSNLLVSRTAVVMLQSRYRGRREREKYSMLRVAILIVQGKCVKYASRQTMALRRMQAATSIQSVWRSFRARSVFMQSKRAASFLQALVRAKARRRKHRQARLLRLIASVVSIQAAWRACIARSTLSRSRSAAVMVQAVVRGRRKRLRYKTYKAALLNAHTSAAVSIQAAWRAKKDRSRLTSWKRAAVLLQALSRRRIRRLELQSASIKRICIDSAAIIIQKAWRGALARSLSVNLKATAIVLQAIVRGSMVRRQRRDIVHVAVLLQAAIRGSLARTAFKTKLSSLLMVQSAWRRFLGRRTLNRSLHACRVIQRHMRRLLLDKEHVKESLRVLAAVKIQARARARLARKCFLQLLKLQSLLRRKAAVSVQARWRSYRTRVSYLKMRAAAVRCQSSHRRAKERLRYRKILLWSVLFQSVSRRYMARVQIARLRNLVASAQSIQKVWRGAIVRLHHRHVLTSAMIIQAFVRTSNQREAFLALRQAASLIQALYRSRVKTSKCRRRAQRPIEAAAALTIQSAWRRFHESLSVHRLAAVRIQAKWRGVVARIRAKQASVSIVMLQALARGSLCRVWQSHRHDCAVRIQAAHHRSSASRRVHDRRCAVHIIQKFCRQMLAQSRPKVRDIAARKIQVWFIIVTIRIHIFQVQSSVVLLQRSLRGILSKRTRLFALLRINAALRSASLLAFKRLSAHDSGLMAELSTAWNREQALVQWYGAMLLQSVARSLLCRRKLNPPVAIPKKRAGCRRPVAVKVVELSVSGRQAVRVELCPVLHWQRNRAARTLQRFARQVLHDAVSAKLRLESDLVGLRAERAAYKVVSRLVDNPEPCANGHPGHSMSPGLSSFGTCIPRLTRRVIVAQSKLQEATRSLFQQHDKDDDCLTLSTNPVAASPLLFRLLPDSSSVPSPISPKPYA